MIARLRPFHGAPLAAVFTALFLLAAGSVAHAQPAPVEIRSRCFDCHLNPNPPEGTKAGPRIDPAVFSASVHGEQRCESCHRTIIEIPHEKDLPPVDCRTCHRADNTVGAPQLRSYREYEESVHGRLVAEGDPRAPRCQNCHGDHDVLRPTVEASHVNKLHIAETCGQCHEEVAAVYAGSSHGRALAEGNLVAPVCTDCHGEHFIQRPGSDESLVSRDQVVNTCASCHEDITKMRMFGKQAITVEAYRESYHGVAHKFGSEATATCVECHRHHDIRGQEDPGASIHSANVPETCGQTGCHVGAGPGFARGRVHVDFHGHAEAGEHFELEGRDRSFAKVFRVVELAFIGLTTTVIFCMILYMALDLFDKWVRKRRLWLRYLAVVTIPLIVTFWLVSIAVRVFVEKLHS